MTNNTLSLFDLSNRYVIKAIFLIKIEEKNEDILEKDTYCVEFIGIVARLNHSVPYRESSSLVSVKVLEIKSGKSQCVLYMINY